MKMDKLFQSKIKSKEKNKKFFYPWFLKKTKRGDISIGILVIGVVLVCALALFSFIVSDSKIGKVFESLEWMEKINLQIEDYSFHKDLSRVDYKMDENGEIILYQELKDSSGFLFWKEEKSIFRVEYKLKSNEE